VREADKYPTNTAVLNGRREKTVIAKENNFKQAGDRFRSFDSGRQVGGEGR
jgi:catalase